ncbi:MAG: HAMP domain-containing protein, partial [Spirochaetes bacterium]|nr:HAMP domain-containing protein [Spirochaetota bacterium]MBU0954367.1 HAMP domain-containing protein [Spirochaetota bacterium]
MKTAVLLPPLRSYLWLKLVLSLAAVVMISSLLTVLLVRRSLDSGMRLMLSKEDRAWADELAEAATVYLRQGGTIEEFSQQIGAVPPNRVYLRRWPERSPTDMPGLPGTPGMMGPMMRRAMNVPPLAITDSSGIILFHTIEGREVRDLSALAIQQGSPIRSAGGISGYVFAGSLLQPALAPQQLEFLQNVSRAAIMSAMLGLLVAVLLGSILFTNIMSPLRALLRATTRVAAGRFDTKLDETRKDELGQLSHGFNTMLASLAEADAWKRRLIADAAHELRTPVGLIQTRLEMMQDGVYPMDQENIGILHGNIMLMSRLLHDLQELSSAEAGTSRIEYSTLALDELARTVLDDFRTAAAERQL